MRVEDTTSYWMATTPTTNYPMLDHDIEVDVAVIGGGITGILTAYETATCGKSVALLEQDRICCGASGRSMAKLTYSHGFTYQKVYRMYGKEAAATYAASNQAGFARIQELIRKHDIECDLVSAANYVYASNPGQIKLVNREFEAMTAAGLRPKRTQPGVRPDEFDYDFEEALVLENQARYHPRKFVLAMAEVCVGMGVSIYEGTPVTCITEGEPCKIDVASGALVHAHSVVMATGRPLDNVHSYAHWYSGPLEHVGLKPARPDTLDFSRHFSMWRGAISVQTTDPVALQSMYFCIEGIPDSFRSQTSDKGSFLFLGRDADVNSGKAEGNDKGGFEEQERIGREHFGAGRTTHQWLGEDVMTPDLLPVIGAASDKSKHLFLACGFCGWGMTKSAMAALLLKDLICVRHSPWESLYSPERPTMSRGIVGSLSEISNDSGAILLVNDERYAVYRDEEGKAHVTSSKCTHLGCQVHWDGEDKEWHCPCHGSKYDKYGHVIHGPAKKDLASVELPSLRN